MSKAAQIADVSRKTVYAYIEEGQVHSVTVGKTLRVCVRSLIRFTDPSGPASP